MCSRGKTIMAEETSEESEEQIIEEPEQHVVYYVDISNLNFAPQDLKIKQGSTLVFRNKERSLVHKLYEVKGLFLGPRMEPGDKFNYTFDTLGNYTIWSIMGKDKGTRMDVEVVK